MRKFLTGLLVGALIMVPVSAFAKNAVESISAYLNPNVKITLDGEPLELENTPIVYEQTTYLPLREIAENIMGFEVAWNQETSTVELLSEPADEQEVAEIENRMPDFRKNRPDYAALFVKDDSLEIESIEAKISQINVEMRQFQYALDYERKYPGTYTDEIIEMFEYELGELEAILPYWTDLLEQKLETQQVEQNE